MTHAIATVTDVAETLADLLQHAPSAFLSDFDGTLSPVAPTPDRAALAPGVAEALTALSGLVDVVGIVTGRGIADARSRIGVDTMLFVGNHGLESQIGDDHRIHPAGVAAQRVLPQALREIERRLATQVSTEGVIFEDKVYSASIHYRIAPDPQVVRRALESIVREIAQAHDFWVSDGKMVFELRAGHAVNKGSAVRQIIEDRKLSSAVFLGDDVTDADAFRVLREMRELSQVKTLAIGVLTPDTDQRVVDSSDYLLDGVEDVVAMMRELVAHLGEKGDRT